MSAQLTSPFLTLGILLAVVGLALCIIYTFRPHRLIPLVALAALVLSLILAKTHSATHVSRIEIDRPPLDTEDAFSYARLLEVRSEDVASVRFAEDTQADVIDRAGLDEADLAYFDSIAAQAPPPEKPATEADLAELEKSVILLDEASANLAYRLNRWNLNLTQILLALAAFVVGYDYLRRFNHPATPSFPLPLPSALPNSFTPLPALIITGPDQSDLTRQLARLAQRGDSFLCLTDDPEVAASAHKTLTAAAKWRRPKTLIHQGPENPTITDDFIFEAIWYRRGSFIVDQPDRSRALIDFTITALSKRKAARARVRQSAHIVWNLSEPPTESQQNQLATLAQATGTSLIIL
jgi:hypothetical protein